MHDILKYATADLFPLTHSGRDGFDHDFHRRGRRRQPFLHLLHQRGARSGAGGAGHQERQQDPRLSQTAVFQSVQDHEPGGGGPRLPWPGSHWNLLLRISSGLFASPNSHDDQQLRAKWVLDFARPSIYLKLFPCQLITLPRLFTFNVTSISKITDCTCVPQQILSQLILLWRPAWEKQRTSAWSWSTPKREMWPGSTTVSQKIDYQEIWNSPVWIFGSVETQQYTCFLFFAGNYHYMTHWFDMVNGTAVLTVENVKTSNEGIYSASYVGDSPLRGAWMRLIVRGSLVHTGSRR